MIFSNTTKVQLWDYTILAARVLLAGTFLVYGGAKLADGQFGLSAAEAAKPVGQLSLFRLSWHLFAQEPFKSFVGISQVVAGLLLLWNRTALLGALLLVPIVANVLVVNLTYIKMPGLYARLSYYLLLLGLIFWHYRARMHAVWVALTHGLSTRCRHPWWAYLLLPGAAIGLELVGTLPQLLYALVRQPAAAGRSLIGLAGTLWAAIGG